MMPFLSNVRAESLALARDGLTCLRFYSRLPIPVLSFETDPHGLAGFGRAIRMLPVAGALVGFLAAAATSLACLLGLPSLLAAVVGLAVLMRATGAMHEDGLADTADGLGGGQTIERRLDIMKDSRLGAYGAATLVLAILARAAAVTALLDRDAPAGAAGAIVAAAAFSRVVGVLPLALLPPARQTGAARAAGKPETAALLMAILIAWLLAIVLVAPIHGIGQATGACLVAILAGLYVVRLARRSLGGQTGDIAGAAQQAAEIAFLSALLVGWSSP